MSVKPAEPIEIFYSYSHKDEELRDELQKHLAVLRHEGVITDWHDRRIGAGREWDGKIDMHLNTAHVILLLISSDFLDSDYCYNVEMKQAVKRHEAGEACVIPVILRPCDWEDAPFGKLQALPKDAVPVTDWPNRDKAFLDVARGIRAVVKELVGPSAGPRRVQMAKTEPPTRVVDRRGNGNHTTITEAIEAANPGDRLLVCPGRYQEGLVMDKPLEILGSGNLGEIVVQATGKNALLFQATMGRVANLTLQQIGGGEWHCVDIAQGRLDLDGCDITSQGRACVAIHGDADPRLRRNCIHDGKFSGVYVYDNGQGILEDNDIFGNALSGVKIDGGNPILRHNHIHDNREGVYVYENGQGTLEINDIFHNHIEVEIATGGNPTLRCNRIHDGKQTGIYVRENGRGMLEDNYIFGNAEAGVTITTGGNPTLHRNRINKNGYVAVQIYNEGGGTIEDNDLRDNAGGVWDISPDSKPHVRRARNQE